MRKISRMEVYLIDRTFIDQELSIAFEMPGFQNPMSDFDKDEKANELVTIEKALSTDISRLVEQLKAKSVDEYIEMRAAVRVLMECGRLEKANYLIDGY